MYLIKVAYAIFGRKYLVFKPNKNKISPEKSENIKAYYY